jgi:hypothetical protein
VCWCCNSYSADKGAGTADRPGVGAALLITTVHACYRRRRLRLWCSCTCRLAPRILYVFQRRRGGALLALTHESCKKKLAEEAIDPVAATECWSWMDGQLGEPRPYCSRTSGCQRERGSEAGKVDAEASSSHLTTRSHSIERAARTQPRLAASLHWHSTATTIQWSMVQNTPSLQRSTATGRHHLPPLSLYIRA